MNTPTEQLFRLVYSTERIQLKRMLITEIKITQENPMILYQVPFELTKTPNRVWKQLLLNIWQSKTQHKGRISKTVMWVFHNRILIDKVPINLVGDELETLVTSTIEITNKQLSMRGQQLI